MGTGAGLIGREAELRALRDGWAAVTAGGSASLLVTGDSGIGKSRLARELTEMVTQSGGLVLSGRTSRQSVISYEPFLDAINGWVRSVGVDAARTLAGADAVHLARLVPSLGHAAPRHDDVEGDRHALFDAVARIFGALAAAQPVLLVLDDMQWADPATLGLLAHVLDAAPSRVAVMVIHRTADPAERSAAAALSPTATVRVDVRGLDSAATAALVAALRDQPDPAADFIERVHHRTDGNPFFIQEIVGQLDRFEDEVVSEGITAILDRNLARLTDSGLRAVRTAAVSIRAETTRTLLAAVLDWPDDQTRDAVDEGIAAGVLATGANGEVGFVHSLYREAVLAGVSGARRARLHGGWADALRKSDADPEPAEVAHHLLAAGPMRPVADAVDWARRAAEVANGRFAFAEAAGLYERAADAVRAGGSVDGPLEVRLLIDGAAALRADDDVEGARRAAATAVERAAVTGDALLRADAAVAYADAVTMWGAGDDDVMEVARAALAAPALPPLQRGRLLLALGTNLAYAHDSGAGAALTEALDLGTTTHDDFVAGAALLALHMLDPSPVDDARIARVEEAVRLQNVNDAAGSGLRMRGSGAWAAGELLATYLTAGRDDDVDRALDDLAAQRDARPTPYRTWALANQQAARALRTLPIAEAEALANHALAMGMQTAQGAALSNYGPQLLVIRVEQDRTAEVEPLLAANVATAGVAAFAAGHAWLLALLGRDDEAAARLRALLADDAAAVHRDSLFACTFSGAAEADAELHDAEAAADVLRHLTPYAGQCLTVSGGSISFGAADRYLGLAAATAGNDTDAIAHFERALVVNEQVRFARQLAWTQADLADALDRTGGAARAKELRSEAAATAAHYGLIRLARRLDT